MSTRTQMVSLLQFVRSVSGMMLKDFPESKFTYQPSPTDNHALWVLGHIAMTDAWIAGLVGAPGISTPETYQPLFGQGSKPVSDPKKYPAVSEVRGLFEKNRAALLAWLEKAPESAFQ